MLFFLSFVDKLKYVVSKKKKEAKMNVCGSSPLMK